MGAVLAVGELAKGDGLSFGVGGDGLLGVVGSGDLF